MNNKPISERTLTFTDHVSTVYYCGQDIYAHTSRHTSSGKVQIGKHCRIHKYLTKMHEYRLRIRQRYGKKAIGTKLDTSALFPDDTLSRLVSCAFLSFIQIRGFSAPSGL